MTGLHSAYLTGRQLYIWDMMRNGLSQSEIARRLNISRQAVNQLAHTIPDKVAAALYDASELNRVDARFVDSTKGILVGRSREFETEAIITLNPKVGLRIWYQHSLGRCKICPDRKQCRSFLFEEASGLGITLTGQERSLEPSKLSSLIFKKALAGNDVRKADTRSDSTNDAKAA